MPGWSAEFKNLWLRSSNEPTDPDPNYVRAYQEWLDGGCPLCEGESTVSKEKDAAIAYMDALIGDKNYEYRCALDAVRSACDEFEEAKRAKDVILMTLRKLNEARTILNGDE